MVFFTKMMQHVMPSFKQRFDVFFSIKSGIEYAFLANLIASIVVFLLVLPDILKIKFSIDKDLLQTALRYSWPLAFITLAASFNSYYTTPLVKFMSGGGSKGEEAAGIFSAGLKLSLLLNLFSTAYNYAAEPFFFNNAQKSENKQVFGQAALAFTIFSCMAAVGIYAYIDIVKELLGKGVQHGVIVMPLLLMANVFLGLYYNVSMWYKLSDNTRTGLLISLMGMVITYAACYLLIPKVGIMGAAWATFLCYLAMLITSYFQGQKYYPLYYPLKKIITYLSLTSVILFTFWMMREYLVIGLGTRIIFNTLIFIVGLYLIYMTELKIYLPKIKSLISSKLRAN